MKTDTGGSENPPEKIFSKPHNWRISGNSVFIMFSFNDGNIPGSILTRDAPDIRPDNPAFFDIRYPAGYQIGQPDTDPISGKAGYPANVYGSWSNDFLIFSPNKAKKKFAQKLI
jgi:hypothetical protein